MLVLGVCFCLLLVLLFYISELVFFVCDSFSIFFLSSLFRIFVLILLLNFLSLLVLIWANICITIVYLLVMFLSLVIDTESRSLFSCRKRYSVSFTAEGMSKSKENRFGRRSAITAYSLFRHPHSRGYMLIACILYCVVCNKHRLEFCGAGRVSKARWRAKMR